MPIKPAARNPELYDPAVLAKLEQEEIADLLAKADERQKHGDAREANEMRQLAHKLATKTSR